MKPTIIIIGKNRIIKTFKNVELVKLHKSRIPINELNNSDQIKQFS